MATITPGTGSTINSTTIEGQLWQLIHFIQNAERASTETERFKATKDDTFILDGDFTLPGTVAYNATTGTFVESALPYLPGVTFNAGSPVGTIKSTSFSQYFIDVIKYIGVWQTNGNKNPQSLRYVTLKFDYQTLEYEGTFKCPYTTALAANGTIAETASEWLTT